MSIASVQSDTSESWDLCSNPCEAQMPLLHCISRGRLGPKKCYICRNTSSIFLWPEFIWGWVVMQPCKIRVLDTTGLPSGRVPSIVEVKPHWYHSFTLPTAQQSSSDYLNLRNFGCVKRVTQVFVLFQPLVFTRKPARVHHLGGRVDQRLPPQLGWRYQIHFNWQLVGWLVGWIQVCFSRALSDWLENMENLYGSNYWN